MAVSLMQQIFTLDKASSNFEKETRLSNHMALTINLREPVKYYAVLQQCSIKQENKKIE